MSIYKKKVKELCLMLPESTKILLEPDSLAISIMLDIMGQAEDWVIHQGTYVKKFKKGAETISIVFNNSLVRKGLLRTFRIQALDTGKYASYKPTVHASPIPRDSEWFWEDGLRVILGSNTILKYYMKIMHLTPGEGYLKFTMDGYTGSVMIPMPEDPNNVNMTLDDPSCIHEQGVFFKYVPALKSPTRKKVKTKTNKKTCKKNTKHAEVTTQVVTNPLPDMPEDKTTEQETTAIVTQDEDSETTVVDTLIAEANITNKGALKKFKKQKPRVQDELVTLWLTWNSFKESEPKNLVKHDSKTGRDVTIQWKHHRSLSLTMIDRLLDAMALYSVEEIGDAISNYATTMFSEDTMWSYAWPLDIFFARGDPNLPKGEGKSWTRFLSDTWSIDTFYPFDTNGVGGKPLTRDERRKIAKETRGRPDFAKNIHKSEIVGYVANTEPELALAILHEFKRRVGSPDYVPNEYEVRHFRQAATNLVNFFKRQGGERRSDAVMVDLLMRAIKKGYYLNKSGNTWEVYMLSKEATWTLYVPAMYKSV